MKKHTQFITSLKHVFCLTVLLGLGFCSFAITVVHAGIFVPVELKEQVQKSHVVVFGKLKNKLSYKCDLKICTEIEMEVSQSIGLNLISETIKFYLPGGSIKNEFEYIHGLPTIVDSENFVIFLKLEQGGYYTPLNLALSKYKQISEGSGEVFKNEVFPFNEKMGAFEASKFFDLISEYKKKPWIIHDKNSINKKIGFDSGSRVIASVSEEKTNNLELLNLFFALSLLVLIARSVQKKISNRR
jgi:hypothetical protein